MKSDVKYTSRDGSYTNNNNEETSAAVLVAKKFALELLPVKTVIATSKAHDLYHREPYCEFITKECLTAERIAES